MNRYTCDVNYGWKNQISWFLSRPLRGRCKDWKYDNIVPSVKQTVFRSTVHYIQLFRERLSYKRGKAYATMPKVIMRNGGFYGCLRELQGVSAWWKETARTHVFVLSLSLLLNHLEPQASKTTLTAHNANRHCRVRFYTSCGTSFVEWAVYISWATFLMFGSCTHPLEQITALSLVWQTLW